MTELPFSLGTDTNCFIYALEDGDGPRGRFLREHMLAVPHRLIASTAALAELLVQRYRIGSRADARRARATFEALPGMELVPVSADIADEAARIRAATNLLLPDAIHIATAIVAGADALLTNDRQLLRAASEIPILLIDDVADV